MMNPTVPRSRHRFPGSAAAICCWLFCLALSAFGQSANTGQISGRVVNPTNDNYLSNVRVSVQGTAIEAVTDEGGFYRLTHVPVGPATVVAKLGGLESEATLVTVVAGQTAVRDFSLSNSGQAARGGEEAMITLQTFTVTDRILTAQAIAMNEQRIAPNIKNVISLDEIGEMGEGNIGEFLKFVPGFSTVYTPAAPQFVTLRGMPSFGTQVTIDGVPSSPAGGGRGFDFGVAVTGNVDRLEVVKTPTPDMSANTVGGSINVVTKGGFIRKTPLFTYNTFLTYSSYDGFDNFSPKFKKVAGPDSSGGDMFNGSTNYDVQPSFDLSYIRPVNDSFAFTLAASRTLRTNDWIFLTPTWNRDTGIQTQTQFNTVTQGTAVGMLSGKFDWKISEKNFLQFSAVHSTRESFTRQNIIVAAAGTGATGGADSTQGAATGVGSVRQNPNSNTQFRSLDHFVLNYRRDGNVWKIESNLSYSVGGFELKDMSEGFVQNIGTTIANLVVRYDGLSGIYDREVPVLSATTRTGVPVNVYDGGELTINTVQTAPREITNEAKRASIDLSRKDIFGLPLAVRFGGVVDRMDKEDFTRQRRWNFVPPGGAAGKLASNYDLIATDFSNRWSFTDANGGKVAPRWLSAQKMYELFKNNPSWFTLDEANAHINEVEGALILQETISAAYLRFDSRLLNDRLWLVGGVRFEHTNVSGRGPRNDISATYQRNPDGSFVTDSAGRYVPITTNAVERTKLQYTKLGLYNEKSYSGYYPSMNASYNLTPDVVARVAYAKTVGRPNHPDIVPNVSINDPESVERVITVSNPGLKPWSADNYDFTVEAYNLKGATLSGSLFQKNISGFFSTRRQLATPALLEQYGLSDEYLDYNIDTTINGGSATVKGLELSYRQSFRFLPEWGRGFQFFINYTKLQLSGPDADNFTEFSPEDINWGVTYGIKKFLIKVNTTQSGAVRRRVFAAATATQPTVYEYRLPLIRTDISMEYQFSKKFVVYASVRNLQSAESRSDRYNRNTPVHAYPGNYQFTPTNFTLGVKGEF